MPTLQRALRGGAGRVAALASFWRPGVLLDGRPGVHCVACVRALRLAEAELQHNGLRLCAHWVPTLPCAARRSTSPSRLAACSSRQMACALTTFTPSAPSVIAASTGSMCLSLVAPQQRPSPNCLCLETQGSAPHPTALTSAALNVRPADRPHFRGTASRLPRLRVPSHAAPQVQDCRHTSQAGRRPPLAGLVSTAVARGFLHAA